MSDPGSDTPEPAAASELDTGPPVSQPDRAQLDVRRRITSTLVRRIFMGQVAVLGVAAVFMGIGIVFPDRLGALALAFLCGAIGGSLSLLKRIRREDLEVLKEVESSITTTLMPFLYGGILALVTYLLFIGGVLTGENGGGLFTSNLFPIFDSGNVGTGTGGEAVTGVDMRAIIKTKPASVKDFALLMIWSVLSGYSEKFVDQILRTLERQNA